jgi:hypothetical protein
VFSRKLTRSIAMGTAAAAIGGGAYGIVSATASSGSSAASPAPSSSATAGQAVPARGGSNARSGPAAGGASGTVARVSTSSFTLSTSAGQTVTIDKGSSTKYAKTTSLAPASDITQGESVLVLGTVNGTTIAASQIIVQPIDGSGSTTTTVVPFQPGAASTSKQVGQVPANYSQGSGMIVSGTAANKATEAALAAYPGGIIDRVVEISNGEYEVHNIGVNWPHHIFVNQDFKVVGAD